MSIARCDPKTKTKREKTSRDLPDTSQASVKSQTFWAGKFRGEGWRCKGDGPVHTGSEMTRENTHCSLVALVPQEGGCPQPYCGGLTNCEAWNLVPKQVYPTPKATSSNWPWHLCQPLESGAAPTPPSPAPADPVFGDTAHLWHL